MYREADADEDEGGPDRAHDEVAERRRQRPAILAHANQDVSRQRGDLEEHEEVEGIARDRDAEQACEGEEVDAVEEVVLRRGDLGADAGAGERHGHRGDAGDDNQHEGVDRVDPVLDAPRHRPAAELVGDHARLENAGQQP